MVRGGGLFLSKGEGVRFSIYFNLKSPKTEELTVCSSQVSEDFEEVRIASRGFGILDVGYRSEVIRELSFFVRKKGLI